MNEGLRVSMGGCTWARMRNSCAATYVAAGLLRTESQLETLAAGAHADVIVLDGDPLEDIGLLADPAAHMPLVIQAGAVVRQR
jgi:imidazolonepropionase-like amidohydrolase